MANMLYGDEERVASDCVMSAAGAGVYADGRRRQHGEGDAN